MQDGYGISEEEFTHVTLVREESRQVIKMTANICQYFKFGYCKFNSLCNKDHITDEICTERSACKTKSCIKRHPKACKRYAIERFCRFGETCAYFHVNEMSEDVKAKVEAAIKPYELKINQLEHEIKNMRLQLNTFCSFAQEAHESISDIESIKSHITQLGDMTYKLEDKIENVQHITKDDNAVKRNTEESSLQTSIIELKSDIEDLRTLNQETHCRIRTVEEQIEEMQADECDDSSDEIELEEQMLENKARMLIIQNNAKYHGLNGKENQKSSEILQKKTNNNE